MYWFPKVAVIKYHKLGDLEQQNLFSYSSESSVSTRTYFLQRLKGRILCLVQLLVSASHPWCSLTCQYIIPISALVTTWASPCVSMSVSLLIRISVILVQYKLILTWYLQRPYWQIRSYSQVPGLVLHMYFEGIQFNPWQ